MVGSFSFFSEKDVEPLPSTTSPSGAHAKPIDQAS
jgi:hypothetical protein